MDNFTPYSGFVGGILIGIASTLLLFANGRVAGISGIVGGLLSPRDGEAGWRVTFIVGLLLGVFAYAFAQGRPLTVTIDTSWQTMAIAGFLVGFGTRLGGGCTSGHGICGIARLSARSIVATAIFMLSAIITVFIVRHLGGA